MTFNLFTRRTIWPHLNLKLRHFGQRIEWVMWISNVVVVNAVVAAMAKCVNVVVLVVVAVIDGVVVIA